MSATRRLPRLMAAAAAILGAALATLATPTPAHAADGDVRVTLSGLGSSMTAGGRGDSFSVRTENRLDTEVIVRRVIVVQLPGLSADQVSVTRSRIPLPTASATQGEIQFEDFTAYRLGPKDKAGDSVTAGFAIQFGQTAPSGEATVTAYALHAGQIMGSDSDSTFVRAGQGEQATTTPPATTPPVETTSPTPAAVDSPVQTLDPNAQSDLLGNDTGIPTILYILGAVLVVVGGIILWLLFRSPKPAMVDGPGGYESGNYEIVKPPTLGYPLQPRHATMNPTTVMPTVADPLIPPPVDPWAQAEPGGAKGPIADPTREFPGHRP